MFGEEVVTNVRSAAPVYEAPQLHLVVGDHVEPLQAAVEAPVRFQLSLQGTFQLRYDAGVPLMLAGNSQRLLAFLALHDRTVTRAATAGTLWPDASEPHAHASLRSALSRLDPVTRRALDVDLVDLRLAAHVDVDIRESRALAQRIVGPEVELPARDLGPAAIAALSSELLPDWYDEWILIEAEDWRQLRLHALESLADRLIAAGLYCDAARAALAAISAEPLRESAQARLLRVHLAEGNQSEALRAFERYREQLLDELGLEPTVALQSLIRQIRAG